jgi:hypothetical protein
MKAWKIISGILSMLLSIVIAAFSFFHFILAAGGYTSASGIYGLLAAFVLFLAGLISLCTCGGRLGGNITSTIFYFLSVVVSFARASSHVYLLISGIWSLICLIIVFIFCFFSKKKAEPVPQVNVRQGGAYYPPQQPQNGQYYQPPQQNVQEGQYYQPPQPPQNGQ